MATNRALIALAQGNVAEAVALIAKGTGANSYSEVLGNINLAKGNYSAAAANLAGVNNNSALLAQILNKDYTAAEKTLANIENVDAYTSYLSAILGARQGNVANVVKGITTALQQKPELKSRIAKDLEFTKYASQIATLVR